MEKETEKREGVPVLSLTRNKPKEPPYRETYPTHTHTHIQTRTQGGGGGG